MDRDLRIFCRPPLGTPVSFGGETNYADDGSPICGLFDEGAGVANFGSVAVDNPGFVIQLPYNAFSRRPQTGEVLTVLAGPWAGDYKVRSSAPVDDGKFREYQLQSA